ncbi:MAG: sigma 54-interacting transcriptional regulator [Polyangiaceae bacterium]|nr:sigma 54-interacting transcriptional regulator [Polyangiaceae bacterium]
MSRRTPEVTVEHAYTSSPEAVPLCLTVSPESGDAFAVVLPALGKVNVGRDPEAAVSLPGRSFSRLHFAVELNGDVVTVRDLGSRNGTLLNNAAIGEAPVPFAFGDELVAGDARFSIVRKTSLPRGALIREIGTAAPGELPEGDADVPPPFRYPSLRKVHNELRRIAPRPISVLIRGETGTGKEVFAREIHRMSKRHGPLVAVNTAALPEALIESELFGHERGAFSGAQAAKAGLIETADKGTLFLDEIGELPMPLQAKLLRVLEEQTVRRVGSNTERKIDLRVISATHQDLETLAQEKKFRQDLLFRLNGAELLLPPLRERRGEMRALAEQLLAELSPEHTPALDASAVQALEAYSFPGNVRELKQVLSRAIAFADHGVITVEHLPNAVVDAAAPKKTADRSAADVRSSVRDFERERIEAALKEAGGNRTRAAEILGLPRRTLIYKLSKMRLSDE